MKKGLLLAWAFCASCAAFAQAPQTLPFSQNWSNAGLIAVDDNWGGVPGIQGRRGDGITGGTGVDPQTLLAADDPGVVDVNANRADPNTFATGGTTEFDGIGNPVVALSGSATADAPYLLIAINTSGKNNISVTYNVRDIDGSVDNAIQQLALQYRIGNAGAFTNIPAGYVADATTGPNLAILVTAVNVILPAACDNKAEVQLRIMTTNAVGNDEWIGIDDISITAPCDITSVAFANVGACNGNGTGDPTDDFFTADVVVDFINPPATGNLQIEPGGDAIGTYSIPVANLVGNSHTFVGVQFKADGTPTVIEVEFTIPANQCVQTQTGPTVQSCSPVCDITSVAFANVGACNDNISSDPTDDFFTADVVVDFVNPPATGNLQIEPGGDAIGIYSIPVANLMGNSHTFVGVQFKADGTPTVAEVEFTIPANQCVQTQTGPTVQPCSAACNVSASIAATNQFCVFPGEVQATGTGGILPYTYQLTGPGGYDQTNTTGLFTGLAAGLYTLTVSDSHVPPCTFTTTVNILFIPDTQAPTFNQNPLPANLLLSCSDPIPAAATLTATDDCDGPVPVSFNQNTTPGTCPQKSVITRTWSATDAAGNNRQHTQTITVEDNTPPTLNGLPAASISVECDAPLPSAPTVTATDLCDPSVSVTFSSNTTPGTCPQEYTLARTWSATDDCGNAAIFTQTITVTDNTPPTFNQSPLPQDITVSCSDISMPEVLDGTDNCDPGVAPPVVFINEIHYDNAGTDAGEFIEIAGTAGVDLSQYQIVLYNGTGGAVYNAMPLSGLIDNEAGGFGAVSFAYPVNGIQNGAPDGIVLATTSGIVLQFLSYEGAFTAVGGVANGILSTDIGVLEDGTNAVGTSLQLTGAGQQYGDFSWVGPLAASAGSLNAGQALNPLPGVIAAMFSQMIEAGDCNGESTITRMWELSDACGNAIMHTQIITVTDTDGPAFSPPPLPMDMNLSCEQPVPPAPTLTAADLCDVPGMLTERVWINEIHYDNAGVDVGEFIEIAGTAGIDLANYTLVLYNGNGGASYNTLVLSGIVPNQANGFGALCFNYGSNIIQNGSPDGVALVHNVMGGMVVQFLSYEGVFAAVGGPANGMNSTDIGVLENGTNAVGTSLYLTGNGDEYADFTWTGPLPASNCGVNAAQTFIPMSMGPVVTFSESQAPGTCPQERSILRTWTATDNCGNETVLNQIISIVDDTPPTVTCPGSITLNLDAFGNASLSLSNITFSYSDNCAPTASLVVLPFPTQFFDCDDEGLTRKVTVRVQDPCGNVGSCTIDVVVAPYSRCTPVILITDPCVCKNNATTLTNGQFGETIKIESLAGKTWTIIANTGLFSSASPIPPSSPILLPIGTAFVENPVGSGDYFLSGIHVDAQGYSITVRSETGQILSIGNSCQYPNPTITADLSGPFCLFSDPVTLTGTPGDANIVSQGFTVNGIPATVFDPSQGLGQYEIVYTVNGGVPKAFGPNDPGCIQSVTLFVNVLATPANIACNDLVYISLDDETCAMELTPDMILEGSYVCFDDYIVEIDQTLPFGNGPWLPAFVDMDDIGKTYQVRVTHLVSDNKCWGNIKIEDKLAPVLLCQNFSVHCNTPDLSANYLFDVLDILAALPTVTDCQTFNLTYTDTETERDCASGLTKVIARKWAAVDASGNSATCNQTIGLIRPTLADVVCPPDYDGLDKPAFQCTNNTYPTPDWIEGQGLQGYPWVFGRPSGCSINWVYTDLPIPVCDGTYKIVRTWRIVDWCVGELIYCNQLIKIVDEQGPAMVCPPNTTVSVEPFQCCAIANLPDVVIRDNCSRINNIGGMVQTFDPFTNQLTGMFPIGGSLEDFPDNNWWDRDTLAAFGSTPCLPIGTQRVTYIAEDNCGNTRSCTFSLKVEDLVPPVVACDELTKVALSADGMAFVDASTFDNGSYDVCSPVFFKARRMNSNSCQSNGQFQDQVKFCCGDIGKVVTIVLRVYDVSVPAGAVSTTLQENHANDCMVDVLVEEKIKPSCLAPAHVTVNCENFDPTLWVYGTAESEDNCCVDSIARTVNYAQFDTVCSKGTITRTFRAVDCAGNFSQCTQRIVVTYDQDYFVRFPNDVIVTVCDGTGNYSAPTFFGEDCELLGVSFQDELFTVVPDACFKIERTWTVINWCTYDPNNGCIEVPNPTPNTTANHTTNLPGPVVSRCGIQAPSPWKSTIVKIYPTDPAPGTDYCTFWDKDANCYKYKQIIKIIDGQRPNLEFCPADTIYCDATANNAGLWNNMDWWDNINQIHDLCEGPADLNITGSDECSGPNIMAHYLLFLDLDFDGTMETVINSLNPPPPGIVYFDNANTPNYGGGTPRQFDVRGNPTNQMYQFGVLQRFNSIGTKKIFSVRWNTQQFPNVYTVPEFPHGTHKIKWYVQDGCGNEVFCEYAFTVRDCKAPTVVCHHGLSTNIMPTGMITLWASDFLQYTEDNCTPAGQIKIGIRKCNTGTGFPFDAQGNPITSVTFTCDELGEQCVELWAIDAAGNADYCETYIMVQDHIGTCPGPEPNNVSGYLKAETSEGIEEAIVHVDGTSPLAVPFSYSDLTDADGLYVVANQLPLQATFTIAPEKDDNPLNGVTTYDLVLISKHILGIEPLNSPYKMIGADANKSGSITTFDIVEIRKLILGIYTELPNNTSWRFVDKGFAFPNVNNPFQTTFPETISATAATNNQIDKDFAGIKIGDVNNTAVANATMQAEERTAGTVLFDVSLTPSPSPNGEGSGDRDVVAGETFEVSFKAAQALKGFQFTAALKGLEAVGAVESDNVGASNFNLLPEGAMAVSIDYADGVAGAAQEFAVRFRATKSGKLSEMLGVSGTVTRAEAYPLEGGRQEVAFRFRSPSGMTIQSVGFELYQNEPNPFVNRTSVGFHLPEAAEATLSVYDETGRVVYQQKGQFEKGSNRISLDHSLIGTAGILFYKLETDKYSATKRMVRAK